MRTATLLILCALTACGAEGVAEDGIDDPFLQGGKADGVSATPQEAKAILDVVNTKSATALRTEVGLASRAAKGIAARRAGGDQVIGTADDVVFTTLAQLDAVPYVGTSAFAKLREFVQSSLASTGTGTSSSKFTVSSTDTPLVIPAAFSRGIDSDIVVTREGTVAAMRLTVAIAHPYVGDLFVQLRGVFCTKTLQSGDIRKSGADLRYTFDIPEAVGSPTDGTWSLHAKSADGEGLIESWSVEFDTAPPAAGEPTIFASHTPIQIAPSSYGASSVVVVKDEREAARASVSFDILYPSVWALQVTLESPEHETQMLFDGTYDSYDSETRLQRTIELPEQAGQSLWGPWKLRVTSDEQAREWGTLSAFSLQGVY